MAVEINRKRPIRRFYSDVSDRLSRKQVNDVKGPAVCRHDMNNVTKTLWLAREKLCHMSKYDHKNIKKKDGHEDKLCDQSKCHGGWHPSREMQTRSKYLTDSFQKSLKLDTKTGEAYDKKEKVAYSNAEIYNPTLMPPPKTAKSLAELESQWVDTGSRSANRRLHEQNKKLYTLRENSVGKQSDRCKEKETSVKSSKCTSPTPSFRTKNPSAVGAIEQRVTTSFRKSNTYREQLSERSPVIWMNLTDTAVQNYLCNVQRRCPNAYVLQLLKHRLESNSDSHVTTITTDTGSIKGEEESGLAETSIYKK